jgi:tetratricopeptide (TPR) repeat protein
MKAAALFYAKKLEDSIDVVNKLLSYHPQVAEGWYIKGVALLQSERWDEGLRSLRRALDLEPRLNPAKDAIDQLFRTNPNNFKYLLDNYKIPVRETYKLLHRLLLKIDPNEWISLRLINIQKGFFIKEAVIKDKEIEFKQTEFQNFLPKIIYELCMNRGPFLIYVGRLKLKDKKTLLLGHLNNLYDLSYMNLDAEKSNGLKIYPLHDEVLENYDMIKKQWAEIWEGVTPLPLHLFYNLELLEDYILQIRDELS